MKLVILDRDGTINFLGEEEFFITSPAEWVPIPGALEAIARLGHAGWRVAVATNQPGLGRGLLDVTTLNAIHGLMHKQLASLGGRIDAVFYCPHTVEENCTCRKPAPGLLEQICERYGMDPRDVPVIGNCAAHLQAGAALGAQLHLVHTGKIGVDDGATPAGLPAGTRMHASLGAVVDYLLAPKVAASENAIEK
ncbi:MAG: D-glycero-beta-D-manno-heptose 1,7-bisphosphate 7-phosphatase [Simplicispira sp.]|nr:D-glycero-beta-D-manno-heptose 1,7-bisphosphate 7-phosphatase [Simplicispira sp.]